MLTNLATCGAMNLGIRYGQLPVEQEAVLFLKPREASSFECVVLDVVDSFLDLALVAWGIGPRGPECRVVVFTEGLNLGVKFRFEPVGLLYSGAEIIQN
jgi:hypothetical protein